MADVEFETDQQFKIPMNSTIGIVRAENKMVEWLMRKGYARSASQAQSMLIGVAILTIFIAVGVWYAVYPSDHSGQIYKGDINSTARF